MTYAPGNAWPPGLHSIRGLFGCCHLLVDADGVVVLDTGLVGEIGRIKRTLETLGRSPQNVRAIVLTHGHLDHTGNLAHIKQWSGAPVLAHREEEKHIQGTYPYEGTARWCGWIERLGRALLAYRPVAIDATFEDGDLLPYWGGLEVIHLPGHSRGHCGFYSAQHGLLFCGDLFASHAVRANLPPPIFNSVPELFAGSIEKVHRLNPRWIVPNHYFGRDGRVHRRRFAGLRSRIQRQQAERRMEIVL